MVIKIKKNGKQNIIEKYQYTGMYFKQLLGRYFNKIRGIQSKLQINLSVKFS
jgi:hypothetical protein